MLLTSFFLATNILCFHFLRYQTFCGSVVGLTMGVQIRKFQSLVNRCNPLSHFGVYCILDIVQDSMEGIFISIVYDISSDFLSG